MGSIINRDRFPEPDATFPEEQPVEFINWHYHRSEIKHTMEDIKLDKHFFETILRENES